MWLVLCEPGDHAALWAYTSLADRGVERTEIVTPAQLVYAQRSVHRVGWSGPALELTLADGREIVSTEVRGVLNRMTTVPTDHLRGVSEPDRSYAMEEMSALVVSWLACLPNVVNPPHPFGLSGRIRHPQEWMKLARDAGFQVWTRDASLGSDGLGDSMCIALGEEVFGQTTDPGLTEACVRLAALSDTPLLGIAVESVPNMGASFVNATPLPDLRLGGEQLLDSLARQWVVAEGGAVILLCGIPSEPPLARVHDELVEMAAPHVVLNQRHAVGSRVELEIDDRTLDGTLTIDGVDYELGSISGAYTRMMDMAMLPEWGNASTTPGDRERMLGTQDALVRWLDSAPCRVVNRSGPMASNQSKPYQAQIITALGFATPKTLITNDPEAVEAFRDECGRVVYKSISGTRSIVSELTEADLPRLHHIRWCPVQFQQYVEGLDVRVHVIGDRVFATAIYSNRTDYRYASRSADGEIDLNPYELDGTIAAACVRLTRHMGLAFSGIDLRIAEDSTIYCFEVNPSPAFSFYESHTEQPIARAVANYLVGSG